MRAKHLKGVGIVVVVGVIACLAAYAGKGVGKADDDEQAVSIDQVPAAVKSTLLKETQGGTIKEIERDDENGKAVYEADVVVNGQKVEVKVADDGTVLSKDADNEENEDQEGEQEDD